MGVTIINQPRAVDFVENPIRFVLEGDQALTTVPVNAAAILNRLGNSVDGQSFRLQFGNGDFDYTFTFKVTPDDSGLQLTAGATIDITVEELKAFYYLSNLYDITLIGTTISIVAKEVGVYTSITVTLTNCASMSMASNVAGIDAILQDNYRIFAELQLKDSGVFERTAKMLLFADMDSRVELNLNSILHAVFTQMDLPDVEMSAPVLALEIVKSYRLRLAEFFGDPPVVRKAVFTDELKVIGGKSPFNVWPDKDFVTDIIYGGKWLSDSLAIVDTWYNATQLLVWFNALGDMTVKQRITINYTDETQSVHEINDMAVTLHQVIIFPAGGLQLDLNTLADAGKKFYSYEISLFTETAPYDIINIGRSVTFSLIQQPKISRVFLFQNHFGAPETLLCTGVATRDLSVKRTQFRSADETHDAIFSDVDEADEVFECSTGHVVKAQAEYMVSAMSSKFFYLKIFNKWQPIKIIDGSLKIMDETADTIVFKFKYSYYFKNKTARLEHSSNYRSYDENYEDGYW